MLTSCNVVELIRLRVFVRSVSSLYICNSGQSISPLTSLKHVANGMF